MRADLVLEIHKRDDFDKTEKALLMALAITCYKDADSCYPSFAHLVKVTGGWGERALRNALRRLEKRGVLSVAHAFRNANVYTFHLSSPARDAEQSDGSPAPHAEQKEISPASGAVSPASHTASSASHDDQSGTTCRQSESEVSNEISSEVSRSLARSFSSMNHSRSRNTDGRPLGAKVDDLLERGGELFIRNGQIDVHRLAYLINQRDGKRNPEPSQGFIQAVSNCVAASRYGGSCATAADAGVTNYL